MARKLFNVTNNDGETIEGLWHFWCPGCKCLHFFQTRPVNGRAVWSFNGDIENPTVKPSILTGHKNFTENRCHSYITDGKIQFLADCHHELKGKTVDLQDIDNS